MTNLLDAWNFPLFILTSSCALEIYLHVCFELRLDQSISYCSLSILVSYGISWWYGRISNLLQRFHLLYRDNIISQILLIYLFNRVRSGSRILLLLQQFFSIFLIIIAKISCWIRRLGGVQWRQVGDGFFLRIPGDLALIKQYLIVEICGNQLLIPIDDVIILYWNQNCDWLLMMDVEL